jgi:hypothetical protein
MADRPSMPPSTPSQLRDSQLRESVRKIRKRVVSVIRRGSKTGKSRSASPQPAEHTPSDTDHEHDGLKHQDEEHADSGDEDHPQHSARSRTSSTPSLRQSLSSHFGSRSGSRAGSRSGSPQPPMTPPLIDGRLAPSSPAATNRRLSITGFGFPRSPSKKHKSKAGETVDTNAPAVRQRTVSTPTGPSPVLASASPEPGKLTVPIPKRERALSHPAHPLAASPIQAASPPAIQGMVFSFATAMEQQGSAHQKAASAPAAMTEIKAPKVEDIGAPYSSPPAGLVESPAAEITTPPLATPIPDVIVAPALDVFTMPTPKIEVEPDTPVLSTEQARERPTTPSTGLTREPSNGSTRDTVSTHTYETSVGQGRDSTGGHSREPAGREPGTGLSRAASTIGSDLGWSVLEPTQEEDEPEEEGKDKKAAKEIQIKVEEVPVNLAEPVKTGKEPAVKKEDTPTKVEDSVQTEGVPFNVEKVDEALKQPLVYHFG